MFKGTIHTVSDVTTIMTTNKTEAKERNRRKGKELKKVEDERRNCVQKSHKLMIFFTLIS